jgi:ATP-dependent Clp protease ATP-binding subunit ClpA
MFERLTHEARRAVFFARGEAGDAGADRIEPEHLLLGLLKADPSLENYFPRSFVGDGVERRIHLQVEAHSPQRAKLPESTNMLLSVDSGSALTAAAEAATKLNRQNVGIEHLVPGLLHLENYFASQILLEQRFDLVQFRSRWAPLNPSDFEQGTNYV